MDVTRKYKQKKSVYDREVSLKNANDSFSKIYPLISEQSNVLDVGCASGALSETLYKNKNCRVYGMEANVESVEKANAKKIFSALHLFDLNNLREDSFPEYKNFFDYIICADVLEHLCNPLDVLKKLCGYLKDSGQIVISLPNVAHASIKANLLLNDWTYTKIGILDETHLRFFTANSLPEFFQKAGLEIASLSYTTLPLDGYQPHRLKELPVALQQFIAKDAHSHIMQYICSCRLAKQQGKKLLRHNFSFFDNCNVSRCRSSIEDRLKRLVLTRCPFLLELLMLCRRLKSKGSFK